MTDFDDVTRNFTDGLGQITKYLPDFVSKLQDADTTFRGHKDFLIGGYSKQINFAGMGASAFADYVDMNISAAQYYQGNWNTFNENTVDLLSQFVRSNGVANTALNNPPLGDLGAWVAAEKPYSSPKGGFYTKEEAWNEMRDAALKGCDMNTVMDTTKGQTYFLNQLYYAQQDILFDITTQHNLRVSQFKDPNSKEAEAEAQNYQDAQTDLQGLHDLISRAITTWFHDMMPVLSDYEQGIQDNKLEVPFYTAPQPLQYHSRTTYGKVLGLPTKNIDGSGLSLDPNKGIAKFVIQSHERVYGNSNIGATGGEEIDGPGINLQNLSATAASASLNAGLNIDGYNGSVTAGVQAGWGLGLSFDHGVQGKFAFLTLGFSWGPAK